MRTERDVAFTKSAAQLVEQAVDAYRKQINEILWERNYVPGVDSVEATASDVEEVLRGMEVIHANRIRRKGRMLQITGGIYAVIGVLIVFIGVTADYFQFLFESNPIFASALVIGVVLSASGFAIWWYGWIVIARARLARRLMADASDSVIRLYSTKAN